MKMYLLLRTGMAHIAVHVVRGSDVDDSDTEEDKTLPQKKPIT